MHINRGVLVCLAEKNVRCFYSIETTRPWFTCTHKMNIPRQYWLYGHGRFMGSVILLVANWSVHVCYHMLACEFYEFHLGITQCPPPPLLHPPSYFYKGRLLFWLLVCFLEQLVPFKICSTLKRKNLLLWEQILPFKSWLPLKREVEMKMAELFPLKVNSYAIMWFLIHHFSNYFSFTFKIRRGSNLKWYSTDRQITVIVIIKIIERRERKQKI